MSFAAIDNLVSATPCLEDGGGLAMRRQAAVLRALADHLERTETPSLRAQFDEELARLHSNLAR